MTQALQVVLADIDALLADGACGRVIVGVTGPPGAGKSHFASALGAELGRDQAAIVPMDGFHLANAQLDRLGRRDRKGAADTFDVHGYLATLGRVAHGYRVADVAVPDFDRARDEPVAAGLLVPAGARVVITEGNYLGLASGGWEPVRALLDKRYYVDCPATVRYERLVRRHLAGGRSRRDAQAWVDTVDEPNARLIATSRGTCDRAFMLR